MKSKQSRIAYLMGCLKKLMHETIAGEQIIHYDGADCDGMCLADDILSELDALGVIDDL